MLTGFHGIHVIMEQFSFRSICSVNKDHLLKEVIWVLKPRLVLAFCGCGLAFVIPYVYAYGGNIL